MMGSIFTKRKDESRAANSTKVKKRSGQSNPRNAGSTQSLYIDRLEVSSFPDLDLYYQPEDTQSLPRYHSSKDLPGQTTPRARVPPRNKPLPVPVHHQENRINSQSQSQTFEDLPGKASPSLPWRSKTSPLLNKQTENRKKDAPEKEDSENYYDSPESNLKPKVRADRNYEPYYDYDISFRKGNILQLLSDGEVEGWYFARNLTTCKEGFVPKDWVTMITSVDVESQKCFFRDMDRELAEEILIQPETEVGTYLLRPSGAGSYALSLRCQSELYELEIKHYKILVVAKGKCYIDADANNKIFSNIVELIKYYTEMPGLRCRLKTPLSQDIPLDALVVKFADLKIGEKLGSGNFSSVYAGTLHNNRQVAVKSLRDGSSMTVEEFRQEAKTMHKLRHPNLVSLLAICEDNGKIYIITERMSKGALLTLLREETEHTIKFKDLMDMAIQVVEGMCYLEKKGFVHRDLRAANVLVGDENITKIADFGLARLLDNYYEHEEFYQEQKGSVFPYKWTAPEAIKQLKFTVKSDIWSFGILLYEMVTYGDEPYAAMSNHGVLHWVVEGNRLKRPTDHHCPATLYNIMRQCWQINSDDRPNFADIKEILNEIKTIA